MKRIMLIAAVVASVLSAAVILFGTITAVSGAAVFAVLAAVVLIFKRGSALRKAIPVFILLAVFSGLLVLRAARAADVASLASGSASVTGYVCEEPEYREVYTVYTVMVRGAYAGDPEREIKLRLYGFSGEALDAFDDFSADVSFRALPHSSKLSSFAEGIFLTASASSIKRSGSVHKGFYYYAVKLRRAIRRHFLNFLPVDEASVIDGVLLGDKSYMSGECYSDFIRCGIIHIITVSGMHLSIICFTLLEVLKHMGFGVKSRFTAAFTVVVAVMAVTGFAPSILRASAMFILAAVGRLINRENDGLNLLGCAVFIILCVNPFAIFSLQLLMSSFSTAGIIIVMPVVEKRIISKIKPGVSGKLLSYFVIAAAQSVAAVTFTLPVNAICFHRFSIISPLASVLTVLPVTVMLITAIIACAFAAIPFFGLISSPLTLLAGLLAKYVLFTVRTLAKIPFAVLPIGSGYFLIALAVASLLLLFTALRFPNRRTMRLAGISSVFLIVISITAHTVFAGGATTVTVAALSDGRSAAVMTRNGHAIIVSAPVSKSDAFLIDDVLTDNGVNCVDLFVICGGGIDPRAGTLLLLDRYETACIAVPDGTKSDGFYGLHNISCVPLSSAVFNLWGDTDLIAAGYDADASVKLTVGRTDILLTEGRDHAAFSIESNSNSFTVVTGGYSGHADSVEVAGRVIDMNAAGSKTTFLINKGTLR